VSWKLKAIDVIDVLSDLKILRRGPAIAARVMAHEFIRSSARRWIGEVGARTAYIRAGQPLGERPHRELQRPLS
jgi:putative transposase